MKFIVVLTQYKRNYLESQLEYISKQSLKPDYLVVHLITFIPLFVLFFFKYETKFILRISGLPKLNIFRAFLWKKINKKIYIVTCPTLSTLDLLKKKSIFDKEKLIYLQDPIIDIKYIQTKKK